MTDTLATALASGVCGVVTTLGLVWMKRRPKNGTALALREFERRVKTDGALIEQMTAALAKQRAVAHDANGYSMRLCAQLYAAGIEPVGRG